MFIRRRQLYDNCKMGQLGWKGVFNLAFIYLQQLLLKYIGLLKAACPNGPLTVPDRWGNSWHWPCLHSFLCKQVVAENFIHCKHVDPIRLEHFLHVFITDNIALVRSILKFMSFYIVPKHLDDLRTGKLESFSVMWSRFAWILLTWVMPSKSTSGLERS